MYSETIQPTSALHPATIAFGIIVAGFQGICKLGGAPRPYGFSGSMLGGDPKGAGGNTIGTGPIGVGA
jgi:hypothetical protein